MMTALFFGQIVKRVGPLLGLILILAVTGHGEDLFAPQLPEGPIRIDGKIDEKEWQKAAAIDNFSILSKPGQPPRERSTVKLWSDGKNLYVAFTCLKETRNIKADVKQNDGNIWNDDCVEIFLAPAASPERYYHFAVNPAGIRYDSLMTGNGFIRSPEWNGDWQAAVNPEKDRYTTEIMIPLRNFPEAAPSPWRIAFARENHHPAELTCWPPNPGGSFHQTSTFANLNGITVNPDVFQAVIGSIVFESRAGQSDTINGNVTINADIKKTLLKPMVKVQVNGPANFIGQEKKELSILKPGMTDIHLPMSFIDNGNYTVKAWLYESGNLIASHTQTLKISNAPFELELDFPRYRHLITPAMKLKKISFTITLKDESPAGKKMQLTLTGIDGKIVAAADYQLKSGKTAMSLAVDSDRLPPGKYRLTAKTEKFQTDCELHKVVPPAGTPDTYFDAANNLVVNGEKLFPLGFYYAPPSWRNYRVAGFNTIIELRAPEKNNLLRQYNVYALGNCRQLLEEALKGKLNERQKKITTQLVSLPLSNFIGWYAADEPELQGEKDIGQYREGLQLIHRDDPVRPIMTTHNSLHGLAMDVDLADIVSVDPYLGYQRGKPDPMISYDRIATYIDEAVKKCDNRKPVWAVLESYPSTYYNGEDLRVARLPTIREIRTSTWLAIVHGARGIIYWESKVNASRKLWPAMKGLAGELKGLQPFLLAADTVPVTIDGPIHYRRRQWNGKELIMAVNTRGAKTTCRLPVASSGYRVVSENRNVKAADGRLTDEFAPYAVHLYCNADIPETGFASILRDYQPADSDIGIGRPDNFATLYRGAKAQASGTNRWSSPFRGITGAPHYCWVPKTADDPSQWLEISLPRPEQLGRLVCYTQEPPGKIELRRGGKWENLAIPTVIPAFLCWNDDLNTWYRSDKQTNDESGFKFFEYRFAPINDIDGLKITTGKPLAVEAYSH